MDSLTLFKMGFLLTISLLRLAVAIPLFLTARRNSLVNLYWLSAQFLALVIAVPFAAAGIWANNWIFWTFISLTEIALIMFVHITFRRERSSPMLVFMTLAIIGLFGGLYGNFTNNFELSAWMVYPNAALVWAWHFIEASRSYGNIVNDESTEDWVKSRYLLMITYSAVDFFGAVLGTLLTTGLWTNDIGSVIVVGINFTSVIFQILTWVMPEAFRKWLNRNQKTHTEERIRAQALAILNILGSAMAEGTGLTKMMALFAIRKIIGEMIKTDDPNKIEAHAVSLKYDAWLDILNNPELYVLVKNAGVNVNPSNALEKAKIALIEKQSLFTLQSR